MTKTIKVKWNGAKDDPESITQYGTVFTKGKWADVPVEGPGNQRNLNKLKGNKWFEVKGEEPAPPPPAPVPTPKAVQHTTAYKVQASANGFVVLDESGKVVEDGSGKPEEYADEASAQEVVDAMNRPAAV